MNGIQSAQIKPEEGGKRTTTLQNRWQYLNFFASCYIFILAKTFNKSIYKVCRLETICNVF